MDARVWGIVVDSFAKLLIPGITVTIPLTLISFALGLILAIVVALVRVAKVPVAPKSRGSTFGCFVVRRCWCSCSLSSLDCRPLALRFRHCLPR